MSTISESAGRQPDAFPSAAHTAPVTKKALWAGRVVSAVPALVLLMGGVMKFVKPAPVVEGFVHLGYSEKLALPIGILEIVCLVLYLVPQTAVLGAILLTAYLGGATATHVRVGDSFFGPVILGALVWLGLLLRDRRLRPLLPLRSREL